MICPHCKRALEEAIDKIEAATEIKWPEETEEHERRQAAVAQNGPSAVHYEVVEPWEDDFEQAEDL